MVKAKAKRKQRVAVEAVLGPTTEQMARGAFEIEDITEKREGGSSISIGKAYRRRPMIETLGERGLFSEAELKALRHYRHHAIIAERSPLRDSLDQQRFGGNGTGPTVELLNAQRVRDDCERAAGSLCAILRAIAVEDLSLSQWAMSLSGSLEKQRSDGKGTRLEPKAGQLGIARMEMQMAAKRVEAELSA